MMLCHPPPQRSEVLDRLGLLASQLEALTSQLQETQQRVACCGDDEAAHDARPLETSVPWAISLGPERSRLKNTVPGIDFLQLGDIVRNKIGNQHAALGFRGAVRSRKLMQHIIDRGSDAEDLLFSASIDWGMLRAGAPQLVPGIFECHEMWHFDMRRQRISLEITPRIDSGDSVIVVFRIEIAALWSTLHGHCCKLESVLYAMPRDTTAILQQGILQSLIEAHDLYTSGLHDELTNVADKKSLEARVDRLATDGPPCCAECLPKAPVVPKVACTSENGPVNIPDLSPIEPAIVHAVASEGIAESLEESCQHSAERDERRIRFSSKESSACTALTESALQPARRGTSEDSSRFPALTRERSEESTASSGYPALTPSVLRPLRRCSPLVMGGPGSISPTSFYSASDCDEKAKAFTIACDYSAQSSVRIASKEWTSRSKELHIDGPKPSRSSIIRRGGVSVIPEASADYVFEGLKEQFNSMEKLEETSLPSSSTPESMDVKQCCEGVTTADIEFIRILKPSQFKVFLQKHGLPLHDFASSALKSKTVKELWAEVVFRECTLIQVVNPNMDGSLSLMRMVRVIFLEIEVLIGSESKFLLLKDEMNKYTTRSDLKTRPSKKMFDDEDCTDATWRCLFQNFDMAEKICKRLFEVQSTERSTETKSSLGFPGLPTLYEMHVVRLKVLDSHHPEMKRLGLPEANSFQTACHFISHVSTRRWVWCSATEFEAAKAASAGTVVKEAEKAVSPGAPVKDVSASGSV